MHERKLLVEPLLRKRTCQFERGLLRQRLNRMRGAVCEYQYQQYLLRQLHEGMHWWKYLLWRRLHMS